MAVRRKPKNPTVDEFIQNGGSSVTPDAEADKDEKPVKLRVPSELLTRIDRAVKKRRPTPSRHQWLLEALYEKLDRESNSK